MLRVLITGADGQLGQALITHQHSQIEYIACSKAELDITNISQIEQVFLLQKPHVVINCAAYTAVDKAEEEAEAAFLINEQGVKNLAKVCQRQNIKLIQISTDYVFSGNKASAYTETDLVEPINLYGHSKLAGEKALQLLDKNALILRSSWLIGAAGQNFFNTILAALKQNKSLQVVNDQYGTPTNAGVLAGWITELLPLFWQGNVYGLYHAAAATTCSWYDIANEIQRLALAENIITKANPITAVSTAEFTLKHRNLMAARPCYSALNARPLLEAINQPAVSWQTMVKACFNLEQ